jgi:triacylglycerol lipase
VNIVLASGFLIPQQFLGINYFRGVKDHLETAGHRVLAPVVPPLAKCEDRAKILAEKINATFGNDPVHIIAHSMGGLDSRMLIGRNFCGLGEPGRILSLTTLSTPHQGSPVADLLAGGGPDDTRRRFLDAIGLLHVDIGALKDLTSDVTKTIPNVAETHPHIRYRSYAASGRANPPQTALLLKPTHDYVKSKTGQDNDGVVAVESARYGEFQGPAWPCDHVEMVGYNLDAVAVPSVFGNFMELVRRTVGFGSPVFDHLAKFDEIIGQLQDIR